MLLYNAGQRERWGGPQPRFPPFSGFSALRHPCGGRLCQLPLQCKCTVRRCLSEENGKDSAEQDVGEGQVRALQMKMRSLKTKRKTTGGGDRLAESPDEKAAGSA